LVSYVGEIPFVFGNANFENRQKLIRGVQTQLASTSNGNISVQMQRYVGDEGYYVWHCENQGGNSQYRQLFYIFYLNDVEGGETEILFNPEKSFLGVYIYKGYYRDVYNILKEFKGVIEIID
jgi:hypothetical protein